MGSGKSKEHSLLVEKIESQGRLASSIAHKVNNPLTYVMNYIFILKQGIKDKESIRMLSSVEDGIGKATEILNKLVSVSSPAIEQSREINLRTLVDETISRLRSEHGGLVKNDVRSRASSVAGKMGLGKVIENLIMNSTEAGSKEIAVTSKSDKNTITLKIIDDGSGIEREHLDKIFEPYFTTKLKREGLGLYESFHIIRSFGGLLWCERTGKNGSEFRIMLNKKH
jgi:two-component system, sporulation sensor kinase E